MAEIGGRGWGVATRRELRRGGLSEREVDWRLQTGALIPEFPGVYRVGHRAPSTEARYTAAVKACGKRAVLCGLAAAWLLGLVKGRVPAPQVLAATERRIPGIETTRCRRLGRRGMTSWKGIPVTTVPETLVDIASSLQSADLARACHEAGVRHKTTPRHVEAVLTRRPNAKGAAKLRGVMSGETKVALSKLESLFERRLRDASYPLPDMNRSADGRRVDCRWPEHRLTVELDSYRFHNSRHSWKQDRKREREAYARADQFRRYDWDDVSEEYEAMLADLGKLLGF